MLHFSNRANRKAKKVKILFFLGGHPRVLEPIEIREVEVDGKKNLDTNEIKLQNVSYIPTWVDNKNSKGKTCYRVLASKRSIHMYETKQDGDLSESDCEKLKRS